MKVYDESCTFGVDCWFNGVFDTLYSWVLISNACGFNLEFRRVNIGISYMNM
jgi:hypothetical protein